jgi:hypothetical protein
VKTTSYEGACRLLEDLVDTFELHRVLGALTDVCQAKAEHLQAAWQDVSAAKRWGSAASILTKADERCRKLGL